MVTAWRFSLFTLAKHNSHSRALFIRSFEFVHFSRQSHFGCLIGWRVVGLTLRYQTRCIRMFAKRRHCRSVVDGAHVLTPHPAVSFSAGCSIGPARVLRLAPSPARLFCGFVSKYMFFWPFHTIYSLFFWYMILSLFFSFLPFFLPFNMIRASWWSSSSSR